MAATPNSESPLLGATPQRPSKVALAEHRGKRTTLAVASVLAIVFFAAVIAFSSRRGDAPSIKGQISLKTNGATSGEGTDWSDLVTVIEEGNSYDCEAELTTVEYAQCYTGMCTLNGDGLTASCACLSLRPSETYESKLKFGWASAIMAKSTAYQDAISSCVSGDDQTTYSDIIKDAIDDGSIYDNYSFTKGTPDRISMNSKAEPLGAFSEKTCDSTIYAAQCMGAPCWDNEYDSYWNTTCICPYSTFTDVVVKDLFSSICDEASDSGSGCAAIGYDSTEYDDSELKQLIQAAINATITVDSSSCPAKISDDDD